MTQEAPKMDPFERWCYTAEDPKTELPLLTHLLIRVCQNDHSRFEEALDITKAAFAAGRRQGQDEAPS